MIQLSFDRDHTGNLPPLSAVALLYVRAVLNVCQGNKTHAAKKLGIDRRSLYRLLAKMKASDTSDGDKEAASWAPYAAATVDAPLMVQEPDKGGTGGATPAVITPDSAPEERIGIGSDGEYTSNGVKW